MFALQSPGPSGCHQLGNLLASAALLRMAPRPKTWSRLPTALRSPELSLSSFKCQLNLSVPAQDSVLAELWVSYIQGCICQISLGGSKFWLLKSTTVLMHRYIESRPPLRFFNSSRGGQKFSWGVQPPNPPDKYSPACTIEKLKNWPHSHLSLPISHQNPCPPLKQKQIKVGVDLPPTRCIIQSTA